MKKPHKKRTNRFYKFEFLKTLNPKLPFNGLKINWFLLKKATRGVPYFLPNKWLSFNLTGLGYKYKYDEWRFEWNPSISITFLGIQLFIEFIPNISTDDHLVSIDSYWEAFLTYQYDTDKSKSIEERIVEMQDKYSCVWVDPNNKTTNYYNIILKPKYRKYIK